MNGIYWMEKIKNNNSNAFCLPLFWYSFITTSKFQWCKCTKIRIPSIWYRFLKTKISQNIFSHKTLSFKERKEACVCVCSCNRRLHCGLLFQPQTQEIAVAATSALSTTTGISCHYWDSARRSSHTFLAEAAEKALLSACAPATTVVFL